jgi:hypothetical protein
MRNPPEHRPPLGAGRLVADSVRLLFRHFGRLFPLAFVPALVVSALAALVAPAIDTDLDPAASPVPALGPGFFLVGLVEVLLGAVVSGVLSLAAIDAVIGKRHGVNEYLAQTLRHLVPILLLGLLVSLATVIGFALFILPGLYVIARYLVYVPAIVFEDAGFAGINRAQDLTRFYRWPLVGAVLLVGLLMLGVTLVLGPLAYAAAGIGVLILLADAILAALYYALIAIFTALVYARLREIKEGLDPRAIAATID